MMDWIDDLKPGDEVAVSEGDTYATARIRKVLKVTATQVIIEWPRSGDDQTRRFRRATGTEVGCKDAWRRPSIGPVTQALRDQLEGQALLRDIERALKGPITLRTLRAIAAALREAA